MFGLFSVFEAHVRADLVVTNSASAVGLSKATVTDCQLNCRIHRSEVASTRAVAALQTKNDALQAEVAGCSAAIESSKRRYDEFRGDLKHHAETARNREVRTMEK